MDSGIKEVAEHRSNEIKKFLIIGIVILTLFVVLIIEDENSPFTRGRKRTKRGQVDEQCENGGKWTEKSRSCTCKFGWIGNRCSVWHNHSCYFDDGSNYRGKLSATTSGLVCQLWTTDHNSRFDLGKRGIGIHNYCRNPDNDKKGLWCYVGGDEFIGYCNATQCPEEIRDLLKLNASEIITEDDTSDAVKFLFGPLISGVCAGVVALLGFIAIAEYARRRRYSKKKRQKLEKLETNKKHQDSKKHKEKKQDADETKSGVRPLGDIITVDVDTGKQKVQTFSSKDRNAVRELLEKNDFGENNDAFVSEEPYKIRKLSKDELTNGHPPPYDISAASSNAIQKPKRKSSDVNTQQLSDAEICADMPSDKENVNYCSLDKNNKYRKKRERQNFRTSPESSQSVIEECATVNETTPSFEYERELVPNRKMRDSRNKSFESTEENVDKNSQKRRDKQRRKVPCSDSSRSVIEECTTANETMSKRSSREQRNPTRKREGRRAREKSSQPTEERRDKYSRKNRQNSHSHREQVKRTSSTESCEVGEDKSRQRRRSKQKKISHERRSVKDLARKFENPNVAEFNTENVDYENDDSAIKSSKPRKTKPRKNNIKPYVDTGVNSRLEPTTFV